MDIIICTIISGAIVGNTIVPFYGAFVGGLIGGIIGYKANKSLYIKGEK